MQVSECVALSGCRVLTGDYEPLQEHLNADALIYAAGLGRIAPFEKLTEQYLAAAAKAGILKETV